MGQDCTKLTLLFHRRLLLTQRHTTQFLTHATYFILHTTRLLDTSKLSLLEQIQPRQDRPVYLLCYFFMIYQSKLSQLSQLSTTGRTILTLLYLLYEVKIEYMTQLFLYDLLVNKPFERTILYIIFLNSLQRQYEIGLLYHTKCMIERLETAIETIGYEVRCLLYRNCTDFFCKVTIDSFFSTNHMTTKGKVDFQIFPQLPKYEFICF